MIRRRMAALLAAALAAACVYTHLQQPELSILEVSLLKGDLLRQELRVRMRVHNPNQVELPVRSITCDVQLNGHAFAHGESTGDFVVPANGDTDFDVAATANAAGALLSLLGSADPGNPQYRITGEVRLSSGLLRSVPFDRTGTLRLH
ncbi:MAG TPA: LEA type 2 family protein [Steroidobacteraceae bacterium]|nr:LEA type 2 family protein [Steroidobacteraceae bacterium]